MSVGEPGPETRERYALVTWSAIAEPGDVEASWLVAGLGAAAALQWCALAAADPVSATIELSAVAPQQQVDRALAATERWRNRAHTADPGPHLERAHAVGGRVVTRVDAEWPLAMNDLGAAAPFALWVRGQGDLGQLLDRAVAIVGARSATSYGEYVAADLAGALADRGWTVASGGAYGIDGAAHRGAIVAGGQTVAFMAGGVDRLYPAGNADLLDKAMATGAVVSEVPPGYAPHRNRFLSRNRLIATAATTVVVESAMRSGALSTARHAAALVRPVGAVPGPITSASSAGPHSLLREGIATCVTCVDDVVELALSMGDALAASLGPGEASADGTDPTPEPHAAGRHEPDFGTSHQRAAYGAVGSRGADTERVATEAGLTLREALVALSALEIAGDVHRSGSLWQRKSATLSAKKRT